jgi:hypothetical protein
MPERYNFLLFRIGLAFALVLVLARCTPGHQFDPTEIFNADMFDTKTKLKGDREPLFPGGVPGTTTGVPPDLVKGYQPPPDQADATAAPAAAAPAVAAPAAAAPKPKPKVAALPAQKRNSVWNQNPQHPAPTRINVGPKPTGPGAEQQAAPVQPSWPAAQSAPAQQTAQPSQPNWPAPPPTAPPQQTAQPSQSIWPNPPSPGTTSQ